MKAFPGHETLARFACIVLVKFILNIEDIFLYEAKQAHVGHR